MDTNSNHLIVVAGPTAVGKTEIALLIADLYQTSILSCDSRQLYNEMNIGTAKPTDSELKKAPHFFINHLSIYDSYSAGKYETEAINLAEELFLKTNQLILTGGTGPDVDASIVNELEETFQKEGLSNLLLQLEKADPDYHQSVDKNNSRRIIRALSVIKQSGKSFTSFRLGQPKKRNFKPIFILLQRDREELYNRINNRVDKMIENGLESEARALYPFKTLKALQTVGYQEFFDFFDGKYTRIKAIELIKQNSRRYAKRQLTWYRKNNHWNTFHPTNHSDIIDFLQSQNIK